jgi:microcystin-dependent protein
MGFTVPNGPDAAVVDQAEPDALDYEALGYRKTGVVSGCAVTAQVVPNMSVNVAAGKAVVDGAPVDVSSGSVTIQTADANPRFDLIVVDDSGVKSAVRGTASATNPLFPSLNLGTYAVLAAVYVGSSTSSIATAAIVDKRIMLSTSFRRSYASSTETVLSSQTTDGVFSVDASGKTTWVDAILQRIGAQAMELTSSLVLRAGEAIPSLLTLRARASAPENQKVLDIQDSSGTTIASVSGSGVFQSANFIQGEGSPLGAITAPKGTLYIDLLTPRNRALWISEGSGVWEPFRSYDPADEGVPVGTMVATLGTVADPGWVMLQGQQISTTDPETEALAQLVGTRYGSGTGTVGLPDFRGKIPIGAGGAVALTIGDVAGAASVELTVENLPAHAHNVTDPGHAHPAAGRAVYGPPAGSLKPSTDPDAVTPFALAVAPADESRVAPTGVSVEPTGQGLAVNTLPPVGAVNWMVKAHATYARISVFTPETLIPVNDGGTTVYMTVAEFQTALGL